MRLGHDDVDSRLKFERKKKINKKEKGRERGIMFVCIGVKETWRLGEWTTKEKGNEIQGIIKRKRRIEWEDTRGKWEERKTI